MGFLPWDALTVRGGSAGHDLRRRLVCIGIGRHPFNPSASIICARGAADDAG